MPSDVPKKKVLWGVDTKDPNAKSRRAFVDRLPLDTTKDDVLEFFGKDCVEGMYLGPHFGFVQFKRPLDMTNALKKHNTEFKGRRIIVIRDLKYDKDNKQNSLPSSSSDSRLISSNGSSSTAIARRTNDRRISVSPPSRRSTNTRTARPRSRSPGWNSRGRSRSQSRDRINSYGTPPSHKTSSPLGRSSDAEFSSSNNYSRFEADRSIMGAAPIPLRRHPLANYSNEFRETYGRETYGSETGFTLQQAQQHTSQLALISPVELPNSIDLSLKLVMSQKTAKGLTVNQIQDIIAYFETEKAALLNLNGTLVSTSLNLTTQQMFYQQPTPAISYPPNEDPVPQQRTAQFSASREHEANTALDVNEREKLEDVMRLIRDTTR